MDTDELWAVTAIQKAALITSWENNALAALNEYEDAKVRFSEAKAAAIARAVRNHANVRPEDAEFTAGADDKVKKAIGDAAFYREEARMYAAMVMMLSRPNVDVRMQIDGS